MLQVLGFASRHAAEEYMIANPETTLGAVHFNVDSSGINYIIQTNTTVRRLRHCCTRLLAVFKMLCFPFETLPAAITQRTLVGQ
jgi:hypothetical protein